MGDTTPIPGPSRGLSGPANLTVLLKIAPDQPYRVLKPAKLLQSALSCSYGEGSSLNHTTQQRPRPSQMGYL